VNPIFSRGDP